MISVAVQDLRYAFRALRKNQGFTAVAAFLLAIGLGSNAAIFNLLHAVLLRPLPGIEEPGRLVLLGRTVEARGFESLSYPDYVDCRDRSEVFTGVAAYAHRAFSVSSAGGTSRVRGAVVSANYFDVLGVRPAHGRAFLRDEESRHGERSVAVISQRLWLRVFGSDAAALGRRLIVNGQPLTIIGVAP